MTLAYFRQTFSLRNFSESYYAFSLWEKNTAFRDFFAAILTAPPAPSSHSRRAENRCHFPPHGEIVTEPRNQFFWAGQSSPNDSPVGADAGTKKESKFFSLETTKNLLPRILEASRALSSGQPRRTGQLSKLMPLALLRLWSFAAAALGRRD